MNTVETKRKELETIILNNPEICDELLRHLQANKEKRQTQAGAAEPEKSSS